MTGNRRILTRRLTISCQSHIYISLQQTYRIETQSSPEKSMYINEDLSVNNTQHVCLKIYQGFVYHSHPIGVAQRRAPPPSLGGGDRNAGGGVEFRKPNHIHHSAQHQKRSKHTRLYLLSLTVVDIFCQGFCDFVQTKDQYIYISTRLYFFFSHIFYIIRYGSLSQFVLRHHTGEGWGVDGQGGGKRLLLV